MLSSIRRLFESGDGGTVIECRNCGTTIGEATEPCPYCGPTEVVDYVIE